jgi:hypothetical protein
MEATPPTRLIVATERIDMELSHLKVWCPPAQLFLAAKGLDMEFGMACPPTF